MNGHEATMAIRAREVEGGLARTPIVGITAHALKGDREKCLEVGMDDYMSKPISPDRLAEKVQSWLAAPGRGAQRTG
jgi:CheY-like chemotaxis protein